jgi:hypothetical protein
MNDLIANHLVNDLVIQMGRSLLQYVGESWPWTGADESGEKEVIDRLVAEQRRSVGRMVEMLARRGHIIDYGAYPTAYTSLHFVALDYLLDRLYEEQKGIAAETDRLADYALAQVDPEATKILAEVRDEAARHLQELEKLVKARKSRQPS